MKLEVRILGVLEVRADGRDLKLRSAKQRELLAVLLLHQGQVVSRDRLVDALWGEAPPDTATKALQVHVSQLRKAQVGVETQAPGYLLRLDGDAVDSKRFERLAREGAAALAGGEAERAADLLREALALWRGPPLADFGSAEFAQPEIARLEELRVSAVENRIEADLALGRGDVVGELEALIASQPFRERLRRQLMLALYQGGRQAEALAAYRETHRVLAEELGIDPSAELQELERAILTQDPRLASPRPHARTGGDVFIGRDAELGVLLARLDAVIAGRGGVLLLAGEAGIGKSRLTDELSRRASTRGVLTLAGPCWEAGGAPPFWPWIRALRTYVRACPPGALGRQAPADLDELAGLLPELNVLGHGSSRPRASDPDEARFRLFDAAASFLRTAATDRPILLVLDDVHAADAPSLLLLRFLAHQLGDARLLVIAAYRNGEVGPGHPLAPAELERAVGTTRIELGGFTVADVERSLTLAAGPELAGGAAPQIHAATDGNPLFVTEIARLLVAEGRLDDPHDPDGLVRPVPLGVRGVIGRRLLRLSPGCRELLATAAVLGREFAHSTLERLAVASRDDVLDAMEEAAAAHVVEPLGGGRLRFTHALVRDSLYDDLAPARRLRTHRDAGTVLERLYAADPEPHLAELAYHFCAAANAGSAVRAADYAQRAAARAAGQLAYEEAARLYALALSVLEREAPEDAAAHCRLLLRFGDAQMRGGESAAARTIFLRVARIAARAGLAELQAEAALAYIGRFLWMRSISDPHLVPLIREALEALGGLEHPLRAKLKARLVPAVRGDLDWAPRAKLGEEAVRMARRLGGSATRRLSPMSSTPAAGAWKVRSRSSRRWPTRRRSSRSVSGSVTTSASSPAWTIGCGPGGRRATCGGWRRTVTPWPGSPTSCASRHSGGSSLSSTLRSRASEDGSSRANGSSSRRTASASGRRCIRRAWPRASSSSRSGPSRAGSLRSRPTCPAGSGEAQGSGSSTACSSSTTPAWAGPRRRPKRSRPSPPTGSRGSARTSSGTGGRPSPPRRAPCSATPNAGRRSTSVCGRARVRS